ncbi:MAG: amidase [Saprospiraceae bacterium]|uniref:Amidase n=1 Tax=Candidatus Opimibacter skivensis TaxID=2982028 RepID=A0A9D7ST29_9BACT|nr:amidase [Candidatus Opimibacter skivensis]
MNKIIYLKEHSAFMALMFLVLIFSCKQDKTIKISDERVAAKFELEGMSVEDLQSKMQSGQYTSHAIVQMYLDRIQEIDKNGPSLNSVIEINPDALAIADSLDNERANKKVRGPMHGIPVLIKDNIDTGDKMHTTAGSLALADNISSHDAFIVKKLREAGAIILGKTNLSEWANFRSTRSSSGWSSRGGQTKNPYMLDRSPCGSSSGSGVAVAADLCVVAVGTETDGSIACPASMNGVVGIKPTVGLLSRSGIIPISKTQDTPGPFGKTVKDAAILLGVMTGIDTSDAVTKESNGKNKTDYTAFLDINGLKGKRIGVEKTLLHNHEAVDALLQKALDQMKSQGATIVEVEFMSKYQELGNKEFDIMKYEFKDGLNRYLASSNSKMKSLADVMKFDSQNEMTAMPFFKQEIMDSSQVKGDLNSKGYIEAMTELPAIRKFLDDMMTTEKLDAFCGPATGPAWCIDLITGDHWTGYGAYGPSAMAGYPSITIPMGLVSELPVGLSFFGRAYDEPGLIAIAYAYEQASKNRVAPKYLKSLVGK